MIVTLLLLLSISFSTEWNSISSSNSNDAVFSLENVSGSSTTFKLSLDGYYSDNIELNNDFFTKIFVNGGTSILKKGAPDLPQLSKSLIIPDESNMSIRIIDAEYIEIENINIIPSKGNLLRSVNPSEIPYIFSDTYNKDEFYPNNLAYLRDPYIFRDHRGQAVVFNPFQYNPVSKTLRAYSSITVEIYETGANGRNIKTRALSDSRNKINKEFQAIYDSHFINSTNTDTRFEYLEDRGNMLIVCYGDFIDEMTPFVDWKNQMGIHTEIVNVSSIGSSSNSIKSYIENYYYDNGLTFALLVGDIAQIPSPTLSGSASDPSYGFIEGGSSDYYAEVIIGRFSANSPSEVTTQVDRSIEYEKYPQNNADWYSKALGVASNQGPGMNGYTDDDFNDWLWDTILSNFTYDSYQGIYDGSGGTATQGITAINNGISIINYTGHGSISSWGNGAALSSSQINSLSNNNKLPFVITVGCNVGEFNNSTSCFAETWLRATNSGEPAGAIAHFGSTISQSWEPPMHGQWAMNKILTESYENNITRSLGGITTNGCMHMNDAQGSSGENETKYWTFFGDPSLWLRTDRPSSLSIYHDDAAMIGQSEFIVDTGIDDVLVSFSKNGELIDSKYSQGGIAIMDLSSGTNQPGDLDIVVTGFNATPYISTVSVLNADGAYLVMNEYELSSTEVNAGSSLSVSLIFENIGNDDASDISVSLSSTSDYISIQNGSDFISYLGSGSSATAGPFIFNISGNAPFAHQFSLDFSFSTEDNSWDSSINMTVGELIESFETGDFTYLPWEYSGESDWSIDSIASSGIYSARSGILENAEAGQNVTSDLLLTITTVEDGSISFAKKISCEDVGSSSGNYYDYLAFYIDGVEQDKWAGESDWSNVSFPVSAGDHELIWRFNKDQGVTSGSDAVWIDNIIFPPCDNLSNSNLGDLNFDGSINVLDVVTLINMILGTTSPDYSSGDMNSDGSLDVLDIVLIVNIITSN